MRSGQETEEDGLHNAFFSFIEMWDVKAVAQTLVDTWNHEKLQADDQADSMFKTEWVFLGG